MMMMMMMFMMMKGQSITRLNLPPDTPEIDDPEVGCGLFEAPDVEDLVDLALLLLPLLVRAVQVQPVAEGVRGCG